MLTGGFHRRAGVTTRAGPLTCPRGGREFLNTLTGGAGLSAAQRLNEPVRCRPIEIGRLRRRLSRGDRLSRALGLDGAGEAGEAHQGLAEGSGVVEAAADGRLLHLVPAASDGGVRGDGANTVAVAASELRLRTSGT